MTPDSPYETELNWYAGAVLFDALEWMESVGELETGTEVFARGVVVLDPDNDEPRLAADGRG